MTERSKRAAVSIESGSTVFGQGMRASSANGLAVRVDGDSKAYLQNASFEGSLEVTGESFADLRGALVNYGAPDELVADAKAMVEKGNNAGAIRVVLNWAHNNLAPERIDSVLNIIGRFWA